MDESTSLLLPKPLVLRASGLVKRYRRRTVVDGVSRLPEPSEQVPD